VLAKHATNYFRCALTILQLEFETFSNRNQQARRKPETDRCLKTKTPTSMNAPTRMPSTTPITTATIKPASVQNTQCSFDNTQSSRPLTTSTGLFSMLNIGLTGRPNILEIGGAGLLTVLLLLHHAKAKCWKHYNLLQYKLLSNEYCTVNTV